MAIKAEDKLTAEVLEELISDANTMRVGPTVYERMGDGAVWTTPGDARRYTLGEIATMWRSHHTAGDISTPTGWAACVR